MEDITSINIFSKHITNLQGIEHFTALTELTCSNNQLTSLDVSKNTAITFLNCSDNQLTSLDVSKNTAITDLNCSGNQLTSLDVSKNTAITNLNCSRNQITSLDVSNNIAIISLNCWNNQLTSLSVVNNTALNFLNCSFNLLKNTEMDAFIQSLPYNYSGTHTLYVVRFPDRDGNVCSTRQVANIKAKGWTPYRAYSDNTNVTGIRWEEYEGGKPIAVTIDATNFPDENFRKYLLEQDYGKDGVITEDELMKITTIDVSGSYGSPRNIASLQGIEFFTALLNLSCNYNQLISLDLSSNIELNYLYCYNNQLTTLNLSRNTKLKRIDCEYNQLTSLDVSKNSALTTLNCYRNQIKDEGMDDFVNSLPFNYSSDVCELHIIGGLATDGNVCTTEHVKAIKAKGWTPYYYDNGWKEYTGSDPTAIKGIPEASTPSISIFNLNGQRLDKQRKGINIINGKKVIVK